MFICTVPVNKSIYHNIPRYTVYRSMILTNPDKLVWPRRRRRYGVSSSPRSPGQFFQSNFERLTDRPTDGDGGARDEAGRAFRRITQPRGRGEREAQFGGLKRRVHDGGRGGRPTRFASERPNVVALRSLPPVLRRNL